MARSTNQNKIENHVSMGTFKGKEIKVYIPWDDESQPAEFEVEIGETTKRYKNLKGAKAAISRIAKNVAKRDPVRVKCVWIGLVNKQEHGRWTGEYRIISGWFIGYSARTGRPKFEVEGEKNTHLKFFACDNVHSVYAYVPGYTESILHELVAALNAKQKAERQLCQADEGMGYIVNNALNANAHRDYSKSAKLPELDGGSLRDRKISIEVAIERDNEALKIFERWRDWYQKHSDQLGAARKRRRR